MSFLSKLFGKPSAANDDTRFGFAIVGLGHIAEKVVEALRESPTTRVTAAVSRTRERAERFAKKYSLPAAYTYDEWDRIAADTTIQATYLSLPVAHHRTFAEHSFAAGKHVMCEKPMASTPADCQAMIDAAHQANRLLMLAYRLDYDPVHHELKRIIDSGELGAIEHVSSDFGFVAKPGWRLDPALAGGGSLFDVGVYPIHAMHEIFGATNVTKAEIVEDAQTRMEIDAAWRGTLANGAGFEGRSSYVRDLPDTVTVRGSLGTATMTDAFNYRRTEMRVELNDGTQRKVTDGKHSPDLFRLECEHLAASVAAGSQPKSSGESGLRDMQTVAQIEQLARRTTR